MTATTIENLRTSDPKRRWNFIPKALENRSTSVSGGVRQDKWTPSVSRDLSKRVFERPWRAKKRFPGALGSPGPSQERSWSGPGAFLASKASYQKPSRGDFGHPNRQRPIWHRFLHDFRQFSIDFRANWGPSVVWFVMLLSGLCRWVAICQSKPQSTLTHTDTSLF